MTKVQVVEKINFTKPAWLVAPERDRRQIEGIHVVILARNEASIVSGTVRAVSMAMEPEDQIHVVADHCMDATAHSARVAGATVHVRNDGGPAGKGQALKWWLQDTKSNSTQDEIIVILDADSIVAPNFFSSIRTRMARGENVVQTRVEPVLRSTSIISCLAAYSESTEQRVNDALRAKLGWSVRLRGTGMVFRRGILERICASLHTLVEDIELTLQLGAEGEPIHFAHETYVADPKPNDQDGAVRQRARWMKGQAQVVRSYFAQIVRLAARGPAGWSLLSSILLKPKTLLIPIKASITAAAWGAFLTWGGIFSAIALIGTLSLFYDAGTFIYGVKYAPDRKEALRALALSPLYLIVWMRSLALSSVSDNNVWHRVRPINPDMPIVEKGFFENLERYLSLNHNPRALAIQPVVADGGD